MMTSLLLFVIITAISVALAILGAVRDSYHTPSTGVLLSMVRALGIVVLAALVFFWGWGRTLIIPERVTGLVLVDEMSADKPALTRSLSALLKKIQDKGGRPVLLTYNSQDEPFMTDISNWQRFSQFEHALLALEWVQDRQEPLPVAILSDHYPGRYLTGLKESWDITWIKPEEHFPDGLIDQVIYPREVFLDQLFQVRVSVTSGSAPMRLSLGLNGELLKEVPLEPDSRSKTTLDLDLVLKHAGHSSVELTLYDMNNFILTRERLPVLALPKPEVIYISPYGITAPLSRILSESSFELTHIPPDKILLEPDYLENNAEVGKSLIILDAVPLPYLRPVFAARMADAVQRLGATILYIPGADVGMDHLGNPLEKLLPVKLGFPDDIDEGKDLAFVAIVDTSMSMFYTAGGRAPHGVFGPNPTGPVSKIQMAKKALVNLSSGIKKEDRFGILTVTDSPSWVVKPDQKRDPAAEAGLISRIYAMGPGINLYSGLLAAYNELISIDSKRKHILIFLDTADVDEYQVSDRGTVWELLEDFRSAEITVSLVGFGKPDDTHIPQLNRFVEESGGYFYLTSELEEIPGFGLKDLEQIADNLVSFQGKKVEFFPTDFTGLETLPRLRGQVISNLKPGASLYAWTDNRLPLYSAWSYGKGRVGVFGADSGLYLAREWTTDANRDAWLPLLSKLMLPDSAESELFYTMGRDGGHRVFLSAVNSASDESYTAQALLSNGSLVTTDMERIGHKKYAARIEDPGIDIRSITVSASRDFSSGKQVLPLPEQTRTGRPLTAGEFTPRHLENEDPSELSREPEILRLMILFVVFLVILDELFRPPGVESMND